MLKPLEYLYFLIAGLEIYSEVTQQEFLRFVTKPMLMIVLILFYLQSTRGKTNKLHKVMAAAFFFSWIGDVALMFVPKDANDLLLMGLPKNPNFFLVGLVGFLITHILYTVAFNDVSWKGAPKLLPAKWWLLLPLVAYMTGLIAALVPSINSVRETKPFLVPVLIYSTAIAIMVVFAINRYKRVGDVSFALVFAGALLFMFSDSIIAINKFLTPFSAASIFIMILYITAQYLIAKGCLAQFNMVKSVE